MKAFRACAIEPPFSLRREDAEGAAVIVVEGEVDIVTAPELRAELDSLVPDGDVVVDLCETPFMDSTGLHVLLAANSAMAGALHIACVPGGPVRRLFDVAHAGDTLKLYASRSDALAAL
jgi:anti-sigma B factor antagonist